MVRVLEKVIAMSGWEASNLVRDRRRKRGRNVYCVLLCLFRGSYYYVKFIIRVLRIRFKNSKTLSFVKNVLCENVCLCIPGDLSFYTKPM